MKKSLIVQELKLAEIATVGGAFYSPAGTSNIEYLSAEGEAYEVNLLQRVAGVTIVKPLVKKDVEYVNGEMQVKKTSTLLAVSKILKAFSYAVMGEINQSVNVVRRDHILPSIKLTGEDEITLKVGESYVDAGATAVDNIDGNITSNISATSNVDTNRAGKYTVRYRVTDSSSNISAEVVRVVNVLDSVVVTPVVSPLFKAVELVEDASKVQLVVNVDHATSMKIVDSRGATIYDETNKNAKISLLGTESGSERDYTIVAKNEESTVSKKIKLSWR